MEEADRFPNQGCAEKQMTALPLDFAIGATPTHPIGRGGGMGSQGSRSESKEFKVQEFREQSKYS